MCRRTAKKCLAATIDLRSGRLMSNDSIYFFSGQAEGWRGVLYQWYYGKEKGCSALLLLMLLLEYGDLLFGASSASQHYASQRSDGWKSRFADEGLATISVCFEFHVIPAPQNMLLCQGPEVARERVRGQEQALLQLLPHTVTTHGATAWCCCAAAAIAR